MKLTSTYFDGWIKIRVFGAPNGQSRVKVDKNLQIAQA